MGCGKVINIKIIKRLKIRKLLLGRAEIVFSVQSVELAIISFYYESGQSITISSYRLTARHSKNKGLLFLNSYIWKTFFAYESGCPKSN